jgi:hypothetical protein
MMRPKPKPTKPKRVYNLTKINGTQPGSRRITKPATPNKLTIRKMSPTALWERRPNRSRSVSSVLVAVKLVCFDIFHPQLVKHNSGYLVRVDKDPATDPFPGGTTRFARSGHSNDQEPPPVPSVLLSKQLLNQSSDHSVPRTIFFSGPTPLPSI